MNLLLGDWRIPLVSGGFSGPLVSGAFSGPRLRGTLFEGEGSHDIVLSQGGATLESSLAQRIDCRLRTVLGEWGLDQGLGLDYFGSIFQKSPDQEEVKRLITRLILQVPGVVRIISLELTIDRAARQLQVIFSVAGTNTPAAGSTVVPL